jgi:hypothetical protein
MLRVAGTLGVALFVLLTLGVAAQAAEVSVSFVQGGSSREPLDVAKSVTYDVKLVGVVHAMRYDVAINVGPDRNDTANYLSFTKSLNANPQASNIVQFDVNFMEPQFRQGEFGRWIADANRTEAWSGAWWKISVTDLDPFSEDIFASDYSGRPELVKFVWQLRDATVTPSQGTNSEYFTYQVQLFSTVQDSLKLEVAPSKEGNWISFGDRNYTTPNSWQTLTWSNVTLPFDFGAAAYKLTGRRQQAFEGPFWPIPFEFKNNTLYPLFGIPDRMFSYALEVNASKPIDIILNALDVGTGKYFPAGVKSYKNNSTWEKLTWSGIKVTFMEEVVGQSSYYFSFHYPGSVASFNSTRNVLGVVYPGPQISSVEVDANVTPANGTIYTPFTYTGRINTTKATADIQLEIQPPNGTIWDAKGKQTYTKSNSILKWPDLSFRSSPEVLGIGKYRFMLGNEVLGEFSGPKIDVAVRNESYHRRPDNNFDYSAEVRSARPKVDMELMFTDDGVAWKRSSLFRTYHRSNNSMDQPPWITLTWENQPWHNTIRVDERRF